MVMHGLIKERLEEYLRGGPGSKVPPEFNQHLRDCEDCREEVSWMQEQSQLLRVLAPPRDIDPAPGFYARILDRIEAQQTPSIWSVFLDPIFGRRLAATSLAMACLLGGYLAFTEAGERTHAAANAETIMAVEEHPPGLGVDRQRDRDTMLVTLAAYRGE